MKHVSGRQRGRFNPEKDKRKNRKINRKANADILEDKKDIQDARNIDIHNNTCAPVDHCSIATPSAEPTAFSINWNTSPSSSGGNPELPTVYKKEVILPTLVPSRSYSKKDSSKDT